MNYLNLFNLIFTLRIFEHLSKKRKTEKLKKALQRDLVRAQENLDHATSLRSVESLKMRINRCKESIKTTDKLLVDLNNFN